MTFFSSAEAGRELVSWGREFEDRASFRKYLKNISDTEAVKCALLATLEATDKINTELASLGRVVLATQELLLASNTKQTNTKQTNTKQTNTEQSIADARLVCWRLAKEPVDEHTQRQKDTDSLISEEQWKELTPGLRTRLQTAGITRFAQLRDNKWRNLKGMGGMAMHRTRDWLDRHDAQDDPPITD